MFLLTQYCMDKVKRKTNKDERAEKRVGTDGINLHKLGLPGHYDQL